MKDSTVDIDLADKPIPADRRTTDQSGERPGILDEYCDGFPAGQNAVDLFEGQWSSAFPVGSGVDSGGPIPLFEDGRIDWMVEQLGGVTGRRILDLGPLEGGHAHRLEATHGAGEVVAVEANERAYLKCLVAKEILGMQRSRFLLGDFNRYMAESGERFDAVVASGVLYHMDDPARHIELMCSVADSVFVWTHYYDADLIAGSGEQVTKKFTRRRPASYKGYEYVLHQQDYLEALGWGGFCGAGRESANWITLDDITKLFALQGFVLTDTSFHEPTHPHGPAIAFLARRSADLGRDTDS